MKLIVFIAANFIVFAAFGQNVGIGTSNPAHKLDVAGNINLTGTLLTNGAAGANGQVLTSTGSGLSWASMGSQAGYRKCRVFMAAGAGTFTIPAGVTELMVEAWGGGSGAGYYCGGTSGGYARTVQAVSPGSVLSFTIGQGSLNGASSTDAGNTVITFPDGQTMSAFGGGGVALNGGSTNVKGLAKSGTGTVTNAFYMFGNMGEPSTITSALHGTTYIETYHFGHGGAPVAMLNPVPVTGGLTYRVNDVPQYAVLTNTTRTPSAGAPASHNGHQISGGDGLVVIWYN